MCQYIDLGELTDTDRRQLADKLSPLISHHLHLVLRDRKEKTMAANEVESLEMMERMANSTATGRLATAVMKEVYGEKAPFDPTFWLFIMELITELIQNCPADARRARRVANKPGFFGKRVLISRVKRKMGGNREFRERDGDKIVKAMLRCGKNITTEGMEAMYIEAG